MAETEALDSDFDSLFAEQRREIAQAKALNADLQFAFNLQMHEAIIASLSSTTNKLNHPSLPSSSSPYPQHVPELAPQNAENDKDDSFLNYTALLIQDIERLEQERRDREASEALKREMRDELDRRIYDQLFSSEIMNIPDVEWEKYGDEYQKPYGTNACSKSGSGSGGACYFKVYCKGMQSEERIRDMRVTVGGIGVAVCDGRDNVIFEVSKRMDSEVGLGAAAAAGVVELQALLEGLNAASSLDLPHVTIFCDDFMVYNYITGRVQPNQSKISTLVNQISILQKKFIECRPYLVASTDMKFAIKLARGAIVSQIAWPEDTSKGKRCLKETCIICYEDRDVTQMFTVDGCMHRYCFSCMKQHVEVKLLNGKEAKCPQEGCRSEVSIEQCGKFLDPKLVEIMSQRKKEASIAVAEKVYCPHMRCSALMSKSEVLEYTKSVFVGCENSGARKCMKCYQFFCINCKVPWHYNMTCYAYKRSNPNPCVEDAMLNSLAKKKLWRQCVKCSNMVELAFGCYHITCRCGYQFCYTCGKEWKNKKATCRCPIWDERNIIRDGQRR